MFWSSAAAMVNHNISAPLMMAFHNHGASVQLKDNLFRVDWTNSILLNKVSQCDSNSTQSSSLNSEMVEPPAPGLISSRLASDQYICIMLLYSFELISPCYPVDRNNLHTDLLGLPPCGWAAMFKDHMGHLFVERLRYL